METYVGYDETQLGLIESFVCELYGNQGHNVNELRYKMYCAKQGKISSESLPPCKNVLHHHTMRACYQVKVWRTALKPDFSIPSPDGHGWVLKDKELFVKWFTGKPAPEECLDLVACSCKRKCVAGSCCCIDNKLCCTAMCAFECENMPDCEQLDQDEEDIYE